MRATNAVDFVIHYRSQAMFKLKNKILAACTLIATGMTAFAAPPQASPLPAGEASMTTLRGFKIGTQCDQLQPAYTALRKEGFKLPSVKFACNLNAGKFRADYLLLEEDDRKEVIELHFTPESVLWRTKVTLTWAGSAALSVRPTPNQVDVSLSDRFGTPFVKTSDGVLLEHAGPGAHAVDYGWSATPPASGPDQTLADRFAWGRWASTLTGVVTRATLRWNDASPQIRLGVEMTDQAVLPAAIKAQDDEIAATAAAWARQDTRMLKGL